MKKLFRFKYEPCNGTCYAWDDDFYKQMRLVPKQEQQKLIKLVVDAHDKLCDNPSYFFGLDKCENTGLFIGHFVQPSRLDVFSGVTLAECIEDMAVAVINTDIPKIGGACEFGNNGIENLAEQIAVACAA